MNVIMLNDLKARLPNYGFVGVATQNEKSFDKLTTEDFIGELLVVGYDKSVVLSVIEEDARWFSPTPKVPMSKFNDTCRYPRAVYYARLKTEHRTVSVFCSHYDDFSVEARALAIKVEAEFIKEKQRLYPNDLILAGGDRNFYPDEGVGPMHAARLQERSGLYAIDDGDTWIGWETDNFCNPFIKDQPQIRIYDQILCSEKPRLYRGYPGQIDENGVVLPPEDADFSCTPRRYASDHFLVYAEFEYEKEKE